MLIDQQDVQNMNPEDLARLQQMQAMQAMYGEEDDGDYGAEGYGEEDQEILSNDDQVEDINRRWTDIMIFIIVYHRLKSLLNRNPIKANI